MDFLGYRKNFEQFADIINDVNDRQAQWIQRILLLSSTLFGVLISLHATIEAARHIRLCFAASTISLALGILLLAIVLYGHTAAVKNKADRYRDELISAIREHRALNPVFGEWPKFFGFCRTTAYILLIISVLLLAAYVLMLAID